MTDAPRKNKQGLLLAKRLLLGQFAVTVGFSLWMVFFSGERAAWSALLGGLVSIVPIACFARCLFAHQGASCSREIVRGFYKGEALKLGVSAALFAGVFRFTTVNPTVFFAAYLAAQISVWFAPWIRVPNNRIERD